MGRKFVLFLSILFSVFLFFSVGIKSVKACTWTLDSNGNWSCVTDTGTTTDTSPNDPCASGCTTTTVTTAVNGSQYSSTGVITTDTTIVTNSSGQVVSDTPPGGFTGSQLDALNASLNSGGESTSGTGTGSSQTGEVYYVNGVEQRHGFYLLDNGNFHPIGNTNSNGCTSTWCPGGNRPPPIVYNCPSSTYPSFDPPASTACGKDYDPVRTGNAFKILNYGSPCGTDRFDGGLPHYAIANCLPKCPQGTYFSLNTKAPFCSSAPWNCGAVGGTWTSASCTYYYYGWNEYDQYVRMSGQGKICTNAPVGDNSYTCKECEAPDPVTLVSPADGAVLNTFETTLTWNALTEAQWHFDNASCGNIDYAYYEIYLGFSPDALYRVAYTTALVNGVNEPVRTFTFNNTASEKVYWKIRAYNAIADKGSDSEIWSFLGYGKPWWQVEDSDVQGPDITSPVTSLSIFGLPGGGGYPGIPVYSGNSNLTTTNASTVGWVAKSGLTPQKTFNYEYFSNSVPDDTTINPIVSAGIDQSTFDSGAPSSDGYYWYKYTGNGGNLTVSSDIDLGDKKVILFVEGANLVLDGKINLTDGSGFFLTVVNGDISINDSVGGTYDTNPDLEGMYVADGTIITSETNANLHVRGSMVGLGGITMQRDMFPDNGTIPGELFEYAPDQILLFPNKLAYRKINWQEVAP